MKKLFPYPKNKFYIFFVKPFFDTFISFILLILLSPLFLLVSILIIFDSGFPIFFLQKRSTLYFKTFTVVKFRTMVNRYNKPLNITIDDKRLTRIGKILRRFSIDELPQLVNVFFGEMSLVGPRPLIKDYPYSKRNFPKKYYERFGVKSGITGLAQINGRNKINYDQKFILDCKYFRKASFLFDIKIILFTILYALKGDGVYD